MQQKIALVTGGNRSIGFETARQLAQQGVHVIIGARRRGQGVEAAMQLQLQGLSVETVELDVSNRNTIIAAADEIGRKHGRLDILVNNAGIVGDKPGAASEQPVSDWRLVFDTNLFGVIETTQAFLPLLRKSEAGRIVNVSSLLGSVALHAQPGTLDAFKNLSAYNVSKSALNAYTLHLAHELSGTSIKVNAIHPGYVKSDMNKGAGDLDLATGAKTSVDLALIGNDGPNGSFSHLGETLPW
ncbi:SDR family oxidoreductase [Hydrocarboniphaga effusa]|uniref:SDR family oxidoreductase n=1 Tax=Hydrocarboniphaga effusa TaxID=243629 RepID=UPI0031379E42